MGVSVAAGMAAGMAVRTFSRHPWRAGRVRVKLSILSTLSADISSDSLTASFHHLIAYSLSAFFTICVYIYHSTLD